MSRFRRPLAATLGVAAVCVLLTPITLAGQGAPAKSATSASRRSTLRTADGRPDLQGIWSFATITPLERPKQFENREFLTETEAAELEKRAVASSEEEGPPATTASIVSTSTKSPLEGAGNLYNQAFWDRGSRVSSSRRTSLIVDPPDGKIPPLTPDGQKRLASIRPFDSLQADSYTDRSLWERCITHNSLPRLSLGYNNNIEIVQNANYVVILYEQIHEPRVIPLDGRPHLPSSVRQILGDSRGHWEGDTLVVDTTNFTDKTNFRGSKENLHLIERLRRVDANTLDYQFTIDDPTTWERSWTVDAPWRKAEGPLVEYACHEGNYSLTDILSAARAAEQGGAGQK